MQSGKPREGTRQPNRGAKILGNATNRQRQMRLSKESNHQRKPQKSERNGFPVEVFSMTIWPDSRNITEKNLAKGAQSLFWKIC
jgi:hypothetical protein